MVHYAHVHGAGASVAKTFVRTALRVLVPFDQDGY